MKILIGNYILHQSTNATSQFDVFKKVVRQKGKNIGQEGEKNIAYAVSLDRAIHLITNEELSERTETVSLKQFLEEYKKQREIFQKQLV